MGKKETEVRRPRRWDTPFGDMMTDELVDILLTISPFSEMDADQFSDATPLHGILRNDARVLDFANGDIIIREGDYGSSAFMILEGTAEVCLRSLPEKLLGNQKVRQKSWFESLAQIWRNSPIAEMRDPETIATNDSLGTRTDEQGRTRVFLQDVPGVLDEKGHATMQAGEIFGEVAAMSRTPRTATVIATGEKTRLLEIRWQGLRDLIRRDSALRTHIEQLYRQNNLNVHLRETPILAGLSQESIDRVAASIEFETHGQFDWQHKYRSSVKKGSQQIVRQEPLIAKQDDYPGGLILIRNGFARVSQKLGSGEQTLSYLGKGAAFGLAELAHNSQNETPVGWQCSLRAIGYLDILRIPTLVVEQEILPQIKKLPTIESQNKSRDEVREMLADVTKTVNDDDTGSEDQLETSLLEFLVEHRFTNGTQTMMIDMDRCTRCDDCVRACASTHDNNPRFVRQGPIHDGKMIANSCMHCVDPVCMIGCPTGAIGRDAETGNVTINESSCIGCSTCANSCPYSNIRMVGVRDKQGANILDAESALPILKATKCDFCSGQPTGPACQNACPHDALVRIDVSDAQTLTDFLNQ